MDPHNETIRNSVTRNPFTPSPVSGLGLAVCGLVATAYAMLFTEAIASNTAPPPPVTVNVASR